MSVLIEPTPSNPSSPLRNGHIMSTLISACRFGKLPAAMLPASSPIELRTAHAHDFAESRSFQTARVFHPAFLCFYIGPCEKFRHDINDRRMLSISRHPKPPALFQAVKEEQSPSWAPTSTSPWGRSTGANF